MLTIENITKTYENKPLLQGVSFSVQSGETICLLGRSGSGKSTLLRIITGLESAESGRVLWQGKDLNGIPVHQRRFGLMFQDYALFPHRNVADNIAFGLKMNGQYSPAEIQARVDQMLVKINLQGFGSRRVTDLSGGEQQRVALARALAPEPLLLMLDEPLGALDRALREQLGQELRRILREMEIPAIYVTHDQEEAFAIADRIILLHDGKIVQQGAPDAVYRQPASAWVARFLGLDNLIAGTLVSANPLRMKTAFGLFESACPPPAAHPGSPLELLVRPSGAEIIPAPVEINTLSGQVLDCFFRGEGFRVTLKEPGGQIFTFYLTEPAAPDSTLHLRLDPQMIVCLGETA